jgi:hypothetical protein
MPSNGPEFTTRPPSCAVCAAASGVAPSSPSPGHHAHDRQLELVRELEVALVVARAPP